MASCMVAICEGLEGLDAAERQAVLLSALTYESQQSPSCCYMLEREQPTGGSALHFFTLRQQICGVISR